MCDVKDILDASHNSADVIVSAIYDFGGNSLGEGLRKFAQEMLNIGAQTGYEQGYVAGSRDGFIKGSLITIPVVGLLTWGVNKFVKEQKTGKVENSKTVNSETTEGKINE